MTKTTRFLALVLAAVLLVAGVPLSASAATPLPNFKVQGSMVSWDNDFYYTDPYNRKRPLGYSEFEFTGFVPNKSWGVKKDSLTTLQKYCDVQWTLSYVQDPLTEQTSDYIGHISVNIQDLLEYWSAMSNQPLEAGVYSITVQCGDHWDPKASSTFNYAYSPRSTGVHGVYVTGGYPEPKLGKAGELMVVRAQKKSGYTFDHWQVDSGEITLADPYSATTSFSMPDENVMLTPVYFKNGTLFAVSFDPNGGSGAMASQVVQAGQEFTFPACAFTPPAGKVFDYWSVAGKKNSSFDPGDSMEVTGDVTVKANWKGNSSGPANPFEDVEEDAYYYEPVLWAVSQTPAVTAGTDATHFSPAKECTRAQVVTFLWNAAGQPEPGISSHPFTDVKEGAYYYKAMLWALENDITAGTSATTFGPGAQCTRGQVVRFLWNAAGQPAPGADSHPFTDVKEGAYYYDAMLWAVNHTPKITAGNTATTFAPGKACTRGQVVSFLYRAMK